MINIQMFSTKECKKCEKLSDFLSQKRIDFVKRVIDEDPEAQTDALMMRITSAPTLVIDKKILRTRDIFAGDVINEASVLLFVGA